MRLWKRKKQQRRQQSKVNELLIDLDPGAKPALYEQIYESIRRDMIDGRFSRGERLPSSRQLAADLQVSRSTVDAAYAQLVSEGYLRSKRGSALFLPQTPIQHIHPFSNLPRCQITEAKQQHRLFTFLLCLPDIAGGHSLYADSLFCCPLRQLPFC